MLIRSNFDARVNGLNWPYVSQHVHLTLALAVPVVIFVYFYCSTSWDVMKVNGNLWLFLTYLKILNDMKLLAVN